MKKLFILMGMILAFLVCGNSAFAQEDGQEDGCDCEKGGLGLAVRKVGGGFGYKSFNSLPGCNTGRGIGIAIGGEDSFFTIGFGYDMGILGIGFTLKDTERTRSVGFGLGYDYGKCRLVWPITEAE